MKIRHIFALVLCVIFVAPASIADDLIPKSINGKYDFINKSGKLVIPARYDYVMSFNEGLAVVKQDGKYGFIDKSGKLVIPARYDYVMSFNEGLAGVKQDGKWGFIDKGGNLVISVIYDVVWPFSKGVAEVKQNGVKKYIVHSGKEFQTRTEALEEASGISRSFPEYLSINMLQFDEFLREKGIKALSKADVQALVEAEIAQWQKKDEFETTAHWRKRVTEQTRQAKVKEIGGRITGEYNGMLQKAQAEYRAMYDALARNYCDYHSRDFASQSIELKPYDADNQTYLISTERFGDILLPVPLSEAPAFKQNWPAIRQQAEAEFAPAGSDIALKSVRFGKYVYNSETKASYAQVDVDYNFRPIDMADIDFNFESISSGQAQAAVTTPAGAMASRRYEPERKKLTAGDASDVDTNIPAGNTMAKSTFAVVIANSNYAYASRVDNAENDGRTMERYLSRTLGIPAKNISTYIDATYGQIASAMTHLRDVADAYGRDNFNVLFYYVGHGLPDEQNRESYILPVDVDPRNTDVCYPLTKLYSQLGGLGARTVTVMVDACFSGANHGDGMLIPQSMGVVVKPKASAPVGNMIVLSAADGDETAYPYASQGHGLFTYWILKKLQETKGNVTIGELSDYVCENVRKVSVTENRKLQTPTVATSPSLSATWRNLPFAR